MSEYEYKTSEVSNFDLDRHIDIMSAERSYDIVHMSGPRDNGYFTIVWKRERRAKAPTVNVNIRPEDCDCLGLAHREECPHNLGPLTF